MNIKFRLTLMSFLQFFIWGSWLISLGGYLGRNLNFEGGQIGSIFATLGIASLVMPGIIGIIADKWVNAERLLGICHLFGAGALFYASTLTDYDHMQIEVLKSKIHRVTVTDANLNYIGSITLDEDLMDAANLIEHEKVSILNNNNGARFETYIIKGERGSGTVCLNGAAARLVQPGDIVLVVSFATMDFEEAKTCKLPPIVNCVAIHGELFYKCNVSSFAELGCKNTSRFDYFLFLYQHS